MADPVPIPAAARASKPKLWILWSNRLGDFKQMQALARALGWPCEERRVRFGFSAIPVLARRFSRPSAADLLKDSWPDLILCSEATCAGLAQFLRQQAGGKIKVVALGRPLGRPRQADLVLTTAQYGLKAGGTIVELALPLGESVPRSTAAGVHDVLLLGGTSAPDVLDAPAALRAFEAARAKARANGRPLVVATSPRTSRRVVSALKPILAAPDRFLAYGDPALDYRGLLASAAEVTVTSDSVSMLADALAAGKLVQVFPLPQRQSLMLKAGNWLRSIATGSGPMAAPARALFDAGVIEPIADRKLLHVRLRDKGLLRLSGEGPSLTVPYRPEDDMARAVAAVRQLMKH